MPAHYHNDREGEPGMAAAPKDAIRREFGKRLQARLVDKGWNQSELARRATEHMPDGATVGRDSISGYVRGIAVPGPIPLDAVCKALGCQPDELLPNWGVVKSSSSRIPPLDVSDAGGGLAWLRVNRAVSWPTAIEIMRMLNDDNTAEAPG